MEKRHWNHSFAGAQYFPKFVNGRVEVVHELRKVGISPCFTQPQCCRSNRAL
jgi:hypothetical protein